MGTTLALLAMGIAVFVVANDFTALSVALPSIEAAFGADVSTVQWVINGYALVFGVLIVTGGRLADLFGRRRIFFLGAGIFAVFSVLGGFAPGIGWLLAARAVMAVGGAMMWPAILGMTYSILPADRAGLAGALILGAAGFGNTAGPLIGGFLTDTFSWRWVFFLNLPVAAGAVLTTWMTVHTSETRPPGTARSIDVPGVTVLTAGLPSLGAGAGVMFQPESTGTVLSVLQAGGWTLLTAVNLMLFSLLHNPCSTTLFTIYRETGKARWAAVAALLPLGLGFLVTFLVAQVWRLAASL